MNYLFNFEHVCLLLTFFGGTNSVYVNCFVDASTATRKKNSLYFKLNSNDALTSQEVGIGIFTTGSTKHFSDFAVRI